MKTAKLVLRFDGGSRGNPGPAALGIVLSDAHGTPVLRLGRFLGTMTNNAAEYHAVTEGLRQALELGATEVQVIGDSELVIKQMLGQYKVRNESLLPLWQEAQRLARKLGKVSYQHQRREHNSEADRLANAAMDRRSEIRITGADAAPPVERRPGTAPVAASSAASTSRAAQWHCPDCGCRISVKRPSKKPHDDIEPFMCCCGMPMRPQE